MKSTAIVISVVVGLGAIGTVYAWADQMNFKLDKPTWDSESAEPHEIAYKIAGDGSFRDLQTAITRKALLDKQIEEMHKKDIPVPLDLINIRNYWDSQARDLSKKVKHYQMKEREMRKLR